MLDAFLKLSDQQNVIIVGHRFTSQGRRNRRLKKVSLSLLKKRGTESDSQNKRKLTTVPPNLTVSKPLLRVMTVYRLNRSSAEGEASSEVT